jgi:hypothetical protein
MGGKTTIQAPQPSAAEQQLMRQQAEALQFQQQTVMEQQRLNEMLMPLIYKQSGIVPQFDEAGNITGFTQDETFGEMQRTSVETAQKSLELQQRQVEEQLRLSPTDEDLQRQRDMQNTQMEILKSQLDKMNAPPDELETMRQEIEKGLLERSKAALAGELPVSPGLISDLGKQEQELNERLRQQFGVGYETSTAGIQTLGDFEERKTNILEGARRGDLTMSEQLSLARQGMGMQAGGAGLNQALMAQALNMGGVNPLQVAGQGFGMGTGGIGTSIDAMRGFTTSQLPIAQAFGSSASGFGGAQQGHQFNRSMQFNAAGFNAQQPNSFGSMFGSILGTIGGPVGTAAGTAIGSKLFG